MGVTMMINNNPNLTENYASLEAFRSARPVSPNYTASKPQEADKVEIAEPKPAEKPVDSEPKPKKKKRSLIQGFKNCIAGVKKFGVATAEYSVATVKGLYYGIITAGGVLAADAAIGVYKMAKNGATAVTPEVTEAGGSALKKASKLLSKTGKFGAVAAGLAVLGYNWFQASLNVSERSAAIDHRWGSGHDEVNR